MEKFKSRFTQSVTERGSERLQAGQMHARGEKCKEEKESVVNRRPVNSEILFKASFVMNFIMCTVTHSLSAFIIALFHTERHRKLTGKGGKFEESSVRLIISANKTVRN